MMKNSFKKTMAFSSVLPLLLLGILCCCFSSIAQANIVGLSNSHHMQSNRAEDGHCSSNGSQNKRQCDCEQIAGIVKNLKIQDSQLTSALFQDFPKAIFTTMLDSDLSEDAFFRHRRLLSLKNIQETAPIYLQISHFLI